MICPQRQSGGAIIANPQKENGYTAIANEIMEALCKTRIPGECRQVLDAILRKTYGWGKCEDFISMGQLSELTGMPRPNIARALKKLVLSKMITRVIKSDNRGSINLLKFNKNYEEWDRGGVIKNDNRGVITFDNYKRKINKEYIYPKNGVIKNDNRAAKKTKPVKMEETDEFIQFYKEYPLKKARLDALKAWHQMNGKRPPLEQILKAIRKQKKWREEDAEAGRKPTFWKYPATWLRAGCWADERNASLDTEEDIW